MKLSGIKTFLIISVSLLIVAGGCKKNNSLSLVDTENASSPPGAGIDKYLKLFFNFSDSNYYYLQQEIKTLYKQNNYQSIWFNDFELTPTAKWILDTLKQSHHYGLHPDFYPTKIIQYNLGQLDSMTNNSQKLQNKTTTELMISFSLINFLTHMKSGIVRGKAIWSSESEGFLRSKIMTGFHQIADGKPIDLVLSSLQPKSYNYELLSNALKKFELPEKWQQTESIIKISDQTPKMVLTVMQLAGFFKGDIDKYTDQYPLIIKSYQQYYHLPQNEVLNTTTNAHLMQQIYHKFMVMSVNIERLRQNPPLSNYYLLVNLPAYQLTIFDNGSPIKKIRVIVGATKTPTPILSGLLTHVVTYPKWNIPPSIVSKEIIPAIMRDSMYLKRKGYYLTNWQGDVLTQSDIKIDDYTENYHPYNIAQGSGEDNALGTLKFLFKNDYDIYLHDTNSRSLFQRKERAMSHGCIRVENPEDLAKYVLSERSFTAMQKQMEKKQTGHLAIEKEIMVYIRYLTCEGDKTGNVTYFKDVYQLDQKDWNLMMNSLYTSSLLTAMKQHQ